MRTTAHRVWTAWVAAELDGVQALARLIRAIDPEAQGGKLDGALAWAWLFADGSQLYVKKVRPEGRVAGGLKADLYGPRGIEYDNNPAVPQPRPTEVETIGDFVTHLGEGDGPPEGAEVLEETDVQRLERTIREMFVSRARNHGAIKVEEL